MNISAELLSFDADSPVWRRNANWINAGALRAYVTTTRARLGKLCNGTVAIRTGSSFDTALSLLVFDGMAKGMLLVPTALSEQDALNLAAQAHCDRVVGLRIGNLPQIDIQFDSVNACAENKTPSELFREIYNDFPTEWLVATSGTTGQPKLVVHTLRSLTRTTKHNPLVGATLVWGLLYDVSRFAGLQVFLQSLCGGSRLIFPDHSQPLRSQIQSLAQGDCTALSATPTLWRKILMLPEGASLQLKQVSLGGEIADDKLLAALRAAFPAARVRHIYASTEAGVGFSVTDGKAGFPSSMLDSPPDGVELRVGTDSVLYVRPCASAERHIPTHLPLGDQGGWIRTGDIVHFLDGRYYFLGRESGVINVGGNKAFPEEIERCILELPEIELAVVRGRKNPFSGYLVEADVVPKNGIALSKEELQEKTRRHCVARLERFEVPAIINVIESLEIGPAGKLSRRGGSN